MIDFKNKNILVTGGKGMIGRSLVDILQTKSPNNILYFTGL